MCIHIIQMHIHYNKKNFKCKVHGFVAFCANGVDCRIEEVVIAWQQIHAMPCLLRPFFIA